ncbi:hypothetical protein PghCCS26_04300 [Paenibacillus glycanilyticus]|uniref:ATP-grasp domain-containing protein n=1 Tax=Paenibacillus glycanilyticus TaxID=126569 RepID=A0ABQ6NE24_9BACL|nr:YheC/YheD family protein [Paenibacillus glycanilyticus]GMK43303.1 hypothetical protein PghCCS26_04300 [Paenibacillus glycanilyticus]
MSLVGILVANRNQRKNVLRQYLQANTMNLKLFCFTPSSINWKRKRIIGLYRSKGKWMLGHFPFPKVVYNRCYDTDRQLMERLGAAIGIKKCFNHINQFNKQEIYTNLSKWLSDYLPTTVPFDKEKAIQLLKAHKDVYFKPCYGHQGKGVIRAEMQASGEIHIGHHYFSPEIIFQDTQQFQESIQKILGNTPYIMQEGIPIQQIDNRVFDIRALVQKNENGLWSVTNLVSRIATKGSFNTSIFDEVCLSHEILNRLYPPDKAAHITRSIYDISLRSAEIMDENTAYHLGEFSVDFALDNDEHAWIIELNGKPQKSLYADIRDQSAVYLRPMQYAKYLCKR